MVKKSPLLFNTLLLIVPFCFLKVRLFTACYLVIVKTMMSEILTLTDLARDITSLIHYCNTAWKVSKYGVFSGPCFSVSGLNRDLQSNSPYSVWIQENMDQEKLRIWTLFTQCNLCQKLTLWSFSTISKVICLNSFSDYCCGCVHLQKR